MQPSQSVDTSIARVWAPDSYTVVAELTRPEAAFVSSFFGGDGGSILPAHLLAAYPNLNHVPFNGAPIGSGPYRFTKWIRGERLDLSANDRYYGTKPAIRHLSIRFVESQSTITNELITHEVDATFFANPSKIAALRSIRDHRVIVTLLPSFGTIVFNLRDPILRGRCGSPGIRVGNRSSHAGGKDHVRAVRSGDGHAWDVHLGIRSQCGLDCV